MAINKNKALKIWESCYGDSLYEEDFHGNLMCKAAYGERDYCVDYCGKILYCGWNIHHILPLAKGGTNCSSNLICTNIITNEEAEDKITFWIENNKYQVRKVYGKKHYEIVSLN